MNLSTLLAFGTTKIVLVSVFGAILIGLIVYLCFVPMKNWFTALFSGAYIPTFKLVGIKNRKLDVNAIVEAYVMAKKGKHGIKLSQIESLVLSGGDAKAVIGALNFAKHSNLNLSFDLASAIELSSHNVMQVVSDAINTKVVTIENVSGYAIDKVEVIANINISVKLKMEKYVDGLGLEELKTTIASCIMENIVKAESHQTLLKEPNKYLLSNIDFRAVTAKSMYTILDINVGGVQTGRDINAEIELRAIEKEKLYAQIEAERNKHAEEMKELRQRTKTEEIKGQLIEAERGIPLAITQAIKEGRFSIMDYYKLMNLQADTAMRKAFVSDKKADDDEEEF